MATSSTFRRALIPTRTIPGWATPSARWANIVSSPSHYRSVSSSPSSPLIASQLSRPFFGGVTHRDARFPQTIRRPYYPVPAPFYHRTHSTSSSDGTGGGRNGNDNPGGEDAPKSSSVDAGSVAASPDPKGTPSGVEHDITSSPIEDTTYNPELVMNDFQDTSYYYHPIDLDLVDRYSSMTNAELMDTSTIPGWDYLIHSPPVSDGAIPKGALVGTVVSTKMQKTVNVAVDRYRIIPKYRKRVKYTRKFMAHDEKEVAKDGDVVLIVPCQRLSRHKHFMLREIVRPKGQL